MRFRAITTALFGLLLLPTRGASPSLPGEVWVENMRLEATDSLILAADTVPLQSFDFEVCASIGGMLTHSPLGKTSWWLDFYSGTEAYPYLRAAVKWGCNPFSAGGFDGHFMQLSLTDLPSGEVLSESQFTGGVQLQKGPNTLAGSWSTGGELVLWVGEKNLMEAASFRGIPLPQRLVVRCNRKMEVDYAICRWYGAGNLPQMPPDDIMAQLPLHSTVPAGMWEFLDRDTDVAIANIGGKYRLAILPDNTDSSRLNIWYMEGAAVNGDAWTPGTLKGFLIATPFDKHYRLVWYDALMQSMGDECVADLSTSDLILTLSFPLHKAKLRLQRVEQTAK